MSRVAVHEELLPAAPAQVFRLLCTPSAIRGWWGADRAVVLAREGGGWAAAWGRHEDAPEYVSTGVISAFEPPQRLRLCRWRHQARTARRGWDGEMSLEFTLEERPDGTLLRVLQEGIPDDRQADAYYAGCREGWIETCGAIRRYLQEGGAR